MKLNQLFLCGAVLVISSCGQNENNNVVTRGETDNQVTMEQDIVKDILEGRETLDLNKFSWVNEPSQYSIEDGKLMLSTEERGLSCIIRRLLRTLDSPYTHNQETIF